MIILVASTELETDDAVASAREAIESVGGGVTSIDTEEAGLLRMHATVPGMGVPSLGGYLASGGVQLDPAAETMLAGTSAGIHASSIGVTLVVRLRGTDDDD